jgi:hypothetical protein
MKSGRRRVGHAAHGAGRGDAVLLRAVWHAGLLHRRAHGHAAGRGLVDGLRHVLHGPRGLAPSQEGVTRWQPRSVWRRLRLRLDLAGSAQLATALGGICETHMVYARATARPRMKTPLSLSSHGGTHMHIPSRRGESISIFSVLFCSFLLPLLLGAKSRTGTPKQSTRL